MQQREKKNKNSGLGALILFGILALSGISESGGDAGLIVGALLVIGVPALIIILAIRAVKKRIDGKKGSLPARHDSRRQRESQLEDRPLVIVPGRDIREYSEHAAEEGFLRDKQRRIDQLDVFLKNGLIEKEEYRILKERYSK